ncbi:hypothetical protein BDR04DRAFT_252770 [Suillus decipiens]|nr:hypothetical protein BDR04DRAFT_252770 [Suillus decipiens]
MKQSAAHRQIQGLPGGYLITHDPTEEMARCALKHAGPILFVTPSSVIMGSNLRTRGCLLVTVSLLVLKLHTLFQFFEKYPPLDQMYDDT